MQVVNKHVALSESDQLVEEKPIPKHTNKYGREFGISDEKMSKWKEEYKKMRVDTKKVLSEVRNNPIDTSSLISSFDIDAQFTLIKWNKGLHISKPFIFIYTFCCFLFTLVVLYLQELIWKL